MPMRCPFCGSTVEPARDAAGQLVCPLCQNTGRLMSAPPGAQSWTASASAPPPAAPQVRPSPYGPPPAAAPAPAQASFSSPPTAPPGQPASAPGKATAALVVGIGAIVLFPIAIILGPIAIVLGVKALRQLKRMPPGTPGQGMAVTGIVLGGVAIMVGITVVLAAVVFVLVSNLGTDLDQWGFDVEAAGEGGVLTVTGYPGFPDWSEFALDGTASCRLPTGAVNFGDQVLCTTDGSVMLVDVETNELLYSTEV